MATRGSSGAAKSVPAQWSMASTDGEGAVVAVIGSRNTVVGFSGDDAPRAVLPTVVGTPRANGVLVGLDIKERYVGDEAMSKRGVLGLRWLVNKGKFVNDVDSGDVEALLRHCYDTELRSNPAEHGLLLAQSPLSCVRTWGTKDGNSPQERIAEVAFEALGVPALCTPHSSVLALFATGRATGTVLELGATVSSSVAVDEGAVIQQSLEYIKVGGDALSDYMMKILSERGYSFTCGGDREIVHDIKEKLGFVALDFDGHPDRRIPSQDGAFEREYELPDGQKISVGNERFRCAEPLFKPAFLGREEGGIEEMVYTSIMRCDVAIRKDLFANVVLSGGGSMFDGLAERLGRELSAIAPRGLFHHPVSVVADPERNYGVWVGGSIFSCTERMWTSAWISRSQYDEEGTAACREVSWSADGSDS
jgi:actin beta/gamma 1